MMSDRVSLLTALLPQTAGNPRAMIALARQMLGAGERTRGLELAEQVFALTAGEGEAGLMAARESQQRGPWLAFPDPA